MLEDLNLLVDPVRVAMRVIEGLHDGVTTSELDNLAAEIAATMTTTHPDYAQLAARISVSNLHKNQEVVLGYHVQIYTIMSIHVPGKTHRFCLMKYMK